MKKLKLLGWNMDIVNLYPSFDIVGKYQCQFPQIVDHIQLDNDGNPFIMVTCERNLTGTVSKLDFAPEWFTYQEIEE